MKTTIIDMINRASEAEDYELADFVYSILQNFAMTINCPSDWRNLGSEMAERYKEDSWVMDNCKLYEF